MQAIIRPATYGLGLTILWVVLAAANPTTTYHLAPLLIAVAVPVGSALTGDITRRASVAGAGIGLALTLAATVVLGPTDGLEGPSLLPTGGAVLEAVVFGFAGAAAGLAYARSRVRA